MTEVNIYIENLYSGLRDDGELSDPLALSPPGASAEDIRAALRDAAANQFPVRFVHETEDGDPPTIRTLTPSALQVNRSGNEVVVGHDHDRDAPRNFRLDRITAVVDAPDVAPYHG